MPQDRSKVDFGTIFGRFFIDFGLTCHGFQAALIRIPSDLAIDDGSNSVSQKKSRDPLRASARVRCAIVSCYAHGFPGLFVPPVCDANIQVHLVV